MHAYIVNVNIVCIKKKKTGIRRVAVFRDETQALIYSDSKYRCLNCVWNVMNCTSSYWVRCG